MRLLLSLLLGLSFGTSNWLVAADTMVVLVRHAEKATDDPKDPGLSEIGRARADTLAKVLADYPLTHAVVSEFKRTRLTAQPTLDQHKISAKVVPVNKDSAQVYSHHVADLVNQELRGEVILLVSHSNTVPAIVLALTGIQVPPIIESSEFDRLYVLTLPEQGKPRIISAKY